MGKGRFKKVQRYNSYFELTASNRRILMPTGQPILNDVYNYYSYLDEDDSYYNCCEEVEVTDYINHLCFKILESFGIEYDKDKDILNPVIYTWDPNLIPGEKFFGIKIHKLEGTETSLRDLFSNITINLDILNCFRFDWSGYMGLKDNYRLYLPYNEEGIEVYKDYLEYSIDKRFPSSYNLEKKLKI